VAAAIASFDLRVTLEDRLFVGFDPEVVGRSAEEECLHCLNILGEPVQNHSRFVDATDLGYIDPSAAKRAFESSN
jgi:hypothetical protein